MKNLNTLIINSRLFIYNNRDVLFSLLTYLLFSAAVLTFGPSCSESVPTELLAEVVDTEEAENLINPPEIQTPQQEPGSVDLFSLKPGEKVSIMSLGTIDPVGTALSDDFDGDGLINKKEMPGNYWIADYPEIETNIAPPVTMKITIFSSSSTQSDEIVSDISSSDFESRRNEGSEKFHQNELALRTIKTGSKSSTDSSNYSVNAGLSAGPFSLGGGGGRSSSDTSTRDTYGKQPFINNIDRSATSVSSSSAQSKARKYRSEKQSKTNITTKISPDAGKVRASLYIKNNSVNMPVKLSNILCSLLFESAEGDKIPVQSFRLRNSDYSIFNIDVYGNSEFGPYVIELSGLNTNEIEQAITKGYTPKIFIVDYMMTHVEDSNYKSTLSSSFTGNNLRIIEENAKGRTALVKLIGPYLRSLYRVGAFDVSPAPFNLCDPSLVSGSSYLSPGTPLKNILKRIQCSGRNIEFGHYVFDYTGIPNSGPDQSVYVEMVKSIDGVSNNFPCKNYISGLDYNNNPVSACVVAINNLTEIDFFKVSIWTIFSKGRYFNNKDYARDSSGNLRYFDASNSIPMLQGVNSTVWVGDNFDIAYLSMSEVTGKINSFGLNPIETNTSFILNSRWSHDKMGLNPFYPDTNSIYLGKAALGERVEFEIKLIDTVNLKPSFGEPFIAGDYYYYENFLYNKSFETNRLFLPGESFDFQVNLGSGGQKTDWFNINRTRNSEITDSNQVLINCGTSYNYLTQVFKVCIQLPDLHNDYNMIIQQLPNVGSDQLVDIFLRPSPNNAYRESIWPERFENINKLKGFLSRPFLQGSSTIEIINYTAMAGFENKVNGNNILIGQNSYIIDHVLKGNFDYYTIFLTSPLLENHLSGETVKISAGLNSPESLVSFQPNTFSEWNSTHPADSKIPDSGNSMHLTNNVSCVNGIDVLTSLLSPLCQGYSFSTLFANYSGAGSFENRLFDQTALNDPYFNIKSELNFQFIQKDFSLINSGLSGIAHLQVAGFGNRIIAVWTAKKTNNLDIYGILIDAETRKAIGPEFIINSNNINDQSIPKIAVKGDKAAVIWLSQETGNLQQVRGRIINIFTGEMNQSGDLILSTESQKGHSNADLAISGNNAIVVWQTISPENRIKGRIVSLLDEIALGNSEFFIDSGLGVSRFRPRVATCGSKTFIAWESFDNGINSVIRAVIVEYSIIDLSTIGAMSNGEKILSTSNIGDQMVIEIACNENVAYATWSNYKAGLKSNLYGRLIDINTGIPRNSDFIIASGNSSFLTSQKVAISGDKAFTFWADMDPVTSHDILGRILDLKTNSFSTAAPFRVNTYTKNIQNLPVISLGKNTLLIAWNSDYNGQDGDIRGRLFDLSTLSFIGNHDFLISTQNIGIQENPRISNDNDIPFAVWINKDILSPIRASFVISPYGEMQYFTAPLIERNYSVRSRILY